MSLEYRRRLIIMCMQIFYLQYFLVKLRVQKICKTFVLSWRENLINNEKCPYQTHICKSNIIKINKIIKYSWSNSNHVYRYRGPDTGDQAQVIYYFLANPRKKDVTFASLSAVIAILTSGIYVPRSKWRRCISGPWHLSAARAQARGWRAATTMQVISIPPPRRLRIRTCLARCAYVRVWYPADMLVSRSGTSVLFWVT